MINAKQMTVVLLSFGPREEAITKADSFNQLAADPKTALYYRDVLGILKAGGVNRRTRRAGKQRKRGADAEVST